jgi:hypothetical protein
VNREAKGVVAALALAAILTKLIVDRDWRKERAYTEGLEGRGDYGRGKVR